MIHRVLLTVVVVILLSAACGEKDAPSTGFTDLNATYAVDVGEEFTISLASNITTGYGWALEVEPPREVVELVDETYIEPDTDLVGAEGRQELTFRAVGDGSTFIELWYVRPFDDPPEPDARARYEVVVGSGGSAVSSE